MSALLRMRALSLANCSAVYDISPLAACSRLRTLELASCQALTSLAPLASCAALRSLDVRKSGLDASMLSREGLRVRGG